MKVHEVLSLLVLFFAFIGTTSANNIFDLWARSGITAAPAAPAHTAPPGIMEDQIPMTVNPAIKFQALAPTIPQSNCDTANNNYENLTGVRGDGDGWVDECQAMSGWLRNPANYGRFRVPGDAWDKSGKDYTVFVSSLHCAFGAFRTDFQPEELLVGAYDVADLIDTSVKYFSTPFRNPPRVEADGFLYCQQDIPLGWGLFNVNANEQHQSDDYS
ncbi:hypothetical protein PGQ11_001760 [Apiospora arundinis]|uniref:Ecp2 effector protein-like domain-containing protein n=1 Tax=Apiospora arundinis TaxID=335852 RepID=A0ABR2JG01_9PEZI